MKQDPATAHNKLLDGIKMRSVKKWSLEDDDDDENIAGPATEKKSTEEEEDEIDPLDAYMQVSLGA